ncbi:HAD family hydrolase [Paenibacillus athensensis]|uniref:Hydrolase of the HAD superfamily n=1 Tax=Paenibacillus athensensis TaxID=1967502 RepID=A0A4Y8PVM7_9BACL|nr:HAD family hydrolase [Paenibacillus athensensis]MCD1258764.1 HAD family hydrolase [Paenibacillus athensensis]
MGVQAIVFDLDDTLYPEHDYVHSGFRAVGEWATARWGISAFYETAAELFEQGVRGSVFNAALERLGVAYAEEEVAAMLAFYRGHRPAIALFADAAWALERFGGEYPLGLITDGYLETQRRKLEALGIAGRFQALVLSDELGREHWKPSAKPYETAAAKLGVAAEACVYVGDNPRKDFVTARRLGWRTVRIVRAAAASADTGAELGPDGRRTALTERKEPRTATGTGTPRSGEYARVESLGAEYEAETTIGSLYELEELLERWKQK